MGALKAVQVQIVGRPWYYLVLLACLAGLGWSSIMWFVTMWQYRRAKRIKRK